MVGEKSLKYARKRRLFEVKLKRISNLGDRKSKDFEEVSL